MKTLTTQETADFLEAATIETSHDAGHAIVHVGISETGSRFVLLNDMRGISVVSESM